MFSFSSSNFFGNSFTIVILLYLLFRNFCCPFCCFPPTSLLHLFSFLFFLFFPSCIVVFWLDCVCLDVRYSPLSCWSSVFFFFLAIFRFSVSASTHLFYLLLAITLMSSLSVPICMTLVRAEYPRFLILSRTRFLCCDCSLYPPFAARQFSSLALFSAFCIRFRIISSRVNHRNLNPLIFCTDLYLSCAYTVSQALILSCITFFCCYALCILGAARLLSLLFGFFCCFLGYNTFNPTFFCVRTFVRNYTCV